MATDTYAERGHGGGRSVRVVEQHDNRLTALLDDGRRVTGQWPVGCDGRTSTVRTTAGID